MRKSKLCEHGDCEDTTPEVSVRYKDYRVSFCCVDHAALWLLRKQYPRAGIVLDWERNNSRAVG